MAPRTRSTNSSPVKKSPPTTTKTIAIEEKHTPVKCLIVSKNVSSTSKILSLQHPADKSRKEFLLCPKTGLHELKRTTVSAANPRSILFSSSEPNDKISQPIANDARFSDGFINKDAEIITVTPYDLAYILLGSIAPEKITTKKSLFQPLEDLLESPETEDKSLQYILQNAEAVVKEAMSRICDTVDAGDEDMFRYSEEKTFKMVLERAQRVAESGLPASLEERFVTRVLDAPMLSVNREETSVSVVVTKATTPSDGDSQADSFDSRSTTVSTTVSAVFSEISSTSTEHTTVEDSIPARVRYLQRVRIAYNFISASCLPSFVSARLTPLLLQADSPLDFSPLEEYLKELGVLRAEAAASRSISDFSLKRGPEDDEIAEERAEKKRKQEEEERKRKANESRGVKELKKVTYRE
ncbi:hypothetical protein Dsin_033014 [Dipteronia sinensis]|uniref:Ribonuclease H2 subunit B n=1 Tax=Dipteronia sinensis TaxID=43782 RepID=A0AAD9ZCH7_9ROSI|nr:hypothetical protein Dsin_033014 [Dipteronia sinensis]